MYFRHLIIHALLATVSIAAYVGTFKPGSSHFEKHKRDSSIDGIYEELDLRDKIFVDSHLKKLVDFEGNRCEACHNKIKYAQNLLKDFPEQDHLISLTLYKYCLEENKGKDSKCESTDFFLFTSQKNSLRESSFESSHLQGASSINFFYNDFTEMVRHFNVSSNLSLNYYCHYKGKYCEAPETPDLTSIINLEALWPPKKPEHQREPNYNSNLDKFNVLHLSDFHNQLRFEVGSEANCSQGLCCLSESFNEDKVSGGYNFTNVLVDAGANLQNAKLSFYPDAKFDVNDTYLEGPYYDVPSYRGWSWAWEPAFTFGNYQCDPPEVMLNHSLKHISSTFGDNNYEFSLFTGDIVDHDVAHCDANTTRLAETRSYRIMKHFLHDVAVYPTLGNHDTFPYGQLAPHSISEDESVNWNDELVSELWYSNGWVNKTIASFARQHYSAFATTTNRGLKIISLNSNCYYKKNLYAFINMETEPDLFGQWDFLINELIESEKIGQRVWILAHIPAGDPDALPIQSEIFASIVERFSPFTIASIFYGHTHRDQFKVLYKDQNPINMAWISQAITPLGPANPSWRFYEVQDESFNILNSFNYYSQLNATWANGGAEPAWQYEYNAREAYDPSRQWPDDAPLNATFWDKFVLSHLRNVSDIDFNQKYTNLMFRENPYITECKNGSKVSSKCYENNYCDAIAFKVDDYDRCVQGFEGF
ncbi:uncharacterized protein CXQ87_002402 [Candidozyma duobushaemuli]|uniref:Calcineurin-like phosphoesterase domain-containing protein n=1 Tax=Candidozyma duobushaemuli TaxID=1231522 RepID=A0A2V1A9X1_9ASCO|nr:uncharacterized protein CXQ87_002402 [[Candida] duobushaemulonis]PVH14274.1 hypothetical protein CXQ87_002402 [[Candida] duobushaemulonis]